MAERNNNNAGDWFDQILSRKLLDVWDLAVCEQVSKDLQKKSNAPALWTEYLERLFRQFDQLVTKIEKYLKPLKQREKDSIQKKKEEEIEKKRKKAKNDLSLKNTEYKAEDTALDYLINTMGLFKKFSQKERQIIDNYARKEYVLLMVLMIDQLQETLEMVMDIYEEKRQMTENFEIFDQTLRRYLVQITIMFPLTESKKGSDADVKDHPSLVITDPEARKIWESRIGSKAYCCTFDSFYAKVFEQDYGKECKNKDLVYYLGYFLNFPKDNIVTTYKWHLLTALFGPYPRFMANFKKYVLGKGFGGLINRLQSEDLLKKYPKHIMMRFSRTNPSYMAFSYNVDGYIAHITNNPSWWAKDPFLSIIKKDTSLKKEDAVPIDTFLEELFFEKGFALVPLRIDSSAVKNMLGLKDYASNLNGYLENHPDDSASEEAEPESEEEPEDGGSYQAYERADEPEEDNPNNRSTDMPLRGYSTLGSVPAPMSSSPARGMYVDALNTSVDSSLNKSTEERKPNNESRELKGYEDETMTEYLNETNVTSNTNTVDNGSHAVPPPNNRYVGMEDEADDDKVGRYQDDLRFKSTEEAPSGYDTYKGTAPERTSAYDAYEVSEDKTEDDLVQADELSRLQQEEAQRKQEQAEKEAREKDEREKAEQEERDRVAREQAEKEEQDRLAREQAEREEQERLAREQAEKQEQERLAKEQEEQERLAREKAEQEERDRLAREQAEREEQERLAREQAEKQEQERLAREQAEREEQERLAREQAEKQERERLAREKEEQERLAKEKAEREAAEKRQREEQERLAREKAEREAAQAKSAAAQKQTTPVSTPRGPPTDITPGSFTYDQLVTKPEGADVKRLEAYLSDESFESVFKMKRDEFYKMPQWKQLEAKKKAKLF